MDFCLRCVSLKLTLALRTLGLGGIDSETSGSFLLFHKNEKSVFVGGGEGRARDRPGPENKVTFSAPQPDCLIILGSRGL